MAAQRKQLSLDANIVFDLAADKDFAHEFREMAFNEADLSPVHPVHPKRLLRAMR